MDDISATFPGPDSSHYIRGILTMEVSCPYEKHSTAGADQARAHAYHSAQDQEVFNTTLKTGQNLNSQYSYSDTLGT